MGRFGRWAAVGVLALGLAGGAASGLAGPGPVPPMDPPERLPAPAAEPAEVPEPAAAVALVWAHPAEVRVNRPAAYTLTVTNTGPGPVQPVVVQVRVPAGVTASDAKPVAKSVGGVLLWELGALAAGESKPLAMSFASPTKGSLTADAWVTCTGSAATTVAVREPKLEAFVEAPETVEIGQMIPVKYGVRNTGDVRLDNVLDGLTPAHPGPSLLRVSSVLTSAPPGGTGYSVEPGQTRTDEMNEPTDRAGVVTFEYKVQAADGLTAKASGRVKVLAPKLEVSVTGPAELRVGKAGVYIVTVTNAGDLTAECVVPTADFDPGLELVGWAEWTPDLDVPVRVYPATDRFDLRPGGSRVFEVEARATGAGSRVCRVAATGKRGAKSAAECRTVVKGVPGIRMEVIDSADPLKVGEETTYEIKVTNTGTEADRNLVLSCDLPPGMTMVDADGPVGGLERIGVDFGLERPIRNRHTVVFDPVRELGPKTEAVFKVKVRAGRAGVAKFTATLTSDHLTTPVVKEESTTVYGE